MSFKEFGNFIKEIRNEHITREEIAKRYKCHPNTIKNYENTGRIPELEYLALLASITGYSLMDLVQRRLLAAQQENELPLEVDVKEVCESKPGYALGDTNGNHRQYAVHNDTMAPTIESNAMVIYDVTQKELKDGKMYVFSFNDAYQIRSVQISTSGAVMLKCKNKAYADETLTKSQAKKLNVIGMVTTVTNFY